MNLFNIILIASGVLEYILLGVQFKQNKANEYLGGILIGVAFLNAAIEFYQLQKSEAILASFLAMIPPTCRVLREGNITNVPAATLVKGDIVLIRMGDKAPADLVIFWANDLKVDNSSLTGESEPQERRFVVDGHDVRPVEAENLVRIPKRPEFCYRTLVYVSLLFARCSIRPLSCLEKDGVSSFAQEIIPSLGRLLP